jgi:leucyl-tRNA---protein transferase
MKFNASIDNTLEEYTLISNQMPLTEPLSATMFDQLLVSGWRFLGLVAVQHSHGVHFGNFVVTIPGRIRLKDFTLSKSQSKLIKKGEKALRFALEPKAVNASDERLFKLHSSRFVDNPPYLLSRMVAYQQGMPQQGFTIRIYAGDEHIATSFFHHSQTAADSSYCVYDPAERWAEYSLGHLTMLLEILHCQQLGLEYYYVGYRFNKPSHFDYKANFNALERYKCFKEWIPCPRIPLRPFIHPFAESTDS